MSSPLFQFSFKVPTSVKTETKSDDIQGAYLQTGFPFSPEPYHRYNFDLRLNSPKDVNAYILGRRYLHPFFHKKVMLPEFSKISRQLWSARNTLLKPYFEYLYYVGDRKARGHSLHAMGGGSDSYKCSLVKVFDQEKMELVTSSYRAPFKVKKARIEDYSSRFSVSLGLVTEDVYLSTSSAR